MNYFAHGRRFVNQPYFMAGTSVPDWLPVLDRRIKARPKGVRPFLDHEDPDLSAMAAGILQHHHDDGWFHVSEPFIKLSMACTGHWRELLGKQSGLRCRFLGHVLVELLLDAELIRRDPDLLDEYYQVMESLDGERVEKLVSTMTTKPASGRCKSPAVDWSRRARQHSPRCSASAASILARRESRLPIMAES